MSMREQRRQAGGEVEMYLDVNAVKEESDDEF